MLIFNQNTFASMKNNTDDESHNLHDKTAKMVLQHKEAFVELLTVFLPHLAKNVDLEALTLDTTNYVGSNFDEQFLDVSYRTTYKGDNERTIAFMFLVEHKRVLSKEVLLQVLNYKCAVLNQDFAQKRPFTTIVAIIIDQGRAKKRRKKKLSDYFKDLPSELKKYIPDFEFELITIQGIPDDTIRSLNKDNILRGMLLMFKHLGDDNFLKENFPEFFTFVEKNPHLLRYLQVYYEYLSRHTEMEAEEFHDLADDYFESQSKSIAMSTYDKIMLKGKLEGKLEERHHQNKKVVRRAMQKGLSIIDIADLVDLTLDSVKLLMEEIEKES